MRTRVPTSTGTMYGTMKQHTEIEDAHYYYYYYLKILHLTIENNMGIFGFFCPPKDDAKDEEEDHTAFDTPSYTQENFEGDVTPSSSTPPIGVRLHGGLKLREEGLTGKGIKVAVLDTGIKPVTQFDGKVVQHSKFRTGKMPHHGTHVAGTIQ